VERPASVVKELVENAIDAGARRIEVITEGGGRHLIRVCDDGSGMTPEDLALAVQRHATSKLPTDDLMAIASLGFRGEALPSIASVSRLSILTRTEAAGQGAAITVEAGRAAPVRPAAASRGTRIEVRDLFFATPARLKFLKSERSEAAAIADVVRRLAMAHPSIAFTLAGDDHRPLTLAASTLDKRLREVLGESFAADSLTLEVGRGPLRVTGRIALPTHNRGTAQHQYLFVNKRVVRDKLLLGAVRAGFSDHLPRDRFPVLALFLELPSSEVDVNVHPAKTEVRFRDGGLVRGVVVSAIRALLEQESQKTAAGELAAAVQRFARPGSPPWDGRQLRSPGWDWRSSPAAPAGFGEAAQASFEAFPPAADARPASEPPAAEALDRPLGAARAQVHETYIVAQTRDGVVIVDQHAAHERLVYERLKRERREAGVRAQLLLVPEVVELDPADAARIVEAQAELAALGLTVEAFGAGAVLVRETPAALGDVDPRRLIRDLSDGLAEWGGEDELERRLDHVAATLACHRSVRAGRRLHQAEMDALLREMEATPNSGQCNHGRPTYVTLKLSDIEALFGRR
jgi:DNA mismatch repair protein MutL